MRGFLTSIEIDQDDKFSSSLEADSMTGFMKWNVNPEVTREFTKNKVALGQKTPSKNQLSKYAEQTLFSLAALLPTFEKSYIKAQNIQPKSIKSTSLNESSILRNPNVDMASNTRQTPGRSCC
jgi:hypothetical protein